MPALKVFSLVFTGVVFITACAECLSGIGYKKCPAILSRSELAARIGGDCGNRGCRGTLDCDPKGGGANACEYTEGCEVYGKVCYEVGFLQSSPACDVQMGFQNCSITVSPTNCATIMKGPVMNNTCPQGCAFDSGIKCGAFLQSCSADECPPNP